MDVRELLEQIRSGNVEIEDVQVRLKNLPYEDLGHTKLDRHRKLRSGFGETVFHQGKSGTYLLEIYKKFYERDKEILGTRASENQAELVKTAMPGVMYDPILRILRVEKPSKECGRCVAVYTGGTADILVAEETTQIVEYFGRSVDRVFNVRVTGIYKFLAQRERLGKANYTVVVIGMGGALGMVIAGLTEYPAIAVPTSVGYGASLHRLLALFTVLSFCVSGISVVSTGNRYGAGYLAVQINKMAVR